MRSWLAAQAQRSVIGSAKPSLQTNQWCLVAELMQSPCILLLSFTASMMGQKALTDSLLMTPDWGEQSVSWRTGLLLRLTWKTGSHGIPLRPRQNLGSGMENRLEPRCNRTCWDQPTSKSFAAKALGALGDSKLPGGSSAPRQQISLCTMECTSKDAASGARHPSSTTAPQQ